MAYAPPEDFCLTCDCSPCQCGTPYDAWELEPDSDVAKIQAYHASHGHLVMASVKRLKIGPMEECDWQENVMTSHRWNILAEATREDLLRQNAAVGFTNKIDPLFKYFYRMVAMD